MVIVQQQNGRTFITLPAEKVKKWKLKKGDLLDINFNQDGNLELSKIE